jgi:hypothetical protein
MPRRRTPTTIICLCRNQIVTYPSSRPSIRLLIHRLEVLGYEVVIFPRDVAWALIPRDYWGFPVTVDDTLLFIVPLPRRNRLLTRSGAFFGNYKDLL